MTWYSIMGLISSIALFLPVFFIVILRLGAYRTFPALLIYYFIVFIYNLMSEGYIKADPGFIRNWGIVNNLLDFPLMFTFLIYFSPSATYTQRLRRFIYAFMAYEIIVLLVRGFNKVAMTIILGPALLATIVFCALFFIRQTKITITHGKATGKALIAASLLFAYGCYGLLYLMFYVIKTQYVEDVFLVYFWVVTFSSPLITAGIIIEQRRIRKLNELKTIRRELSDVYRAENKIVPQRTTLFDFDRDQWR